MPIQELCRVAQVQEIKPGIASILLQSKQIAAQTAPGQFVHLACGEGNLLRRPISVCLAHGEYMWLVFQIKGAGTQWLASRQAGDAVDVLGPLGHGFDLSQAGEKPVFVGGGIGVPPLLYAMKTAREQGAEPSSILGFRSQAAVILEDDFREEGDTAITTDDGSYEEKGFVSDVLKRKIRSVSAVYACGPKGMLRAVAQIAMEQGIPCQVSLEERMGCGLGACLVCACQLAAENGEMRYGHVCKDGPVFDAREVKW